MAKRQDSKGTKKPLRQNGTATNRVLRKEYDTTRGLALHGTFEEFLTSDYAKQYEGKVQLIFTSPPFPLNRKKKYGNLKGEKYVKWLADFARKFRKLLNPNDSFVCRRISGSGGGLPSLSTFALQFL